MKIHPSLSTTTFTSSSPLTNKQFIGCKINNNLLVISGFDIISANNCIVKNYACVLLYPFSPYSLILNLSQKESDCPML